MRLPPLHARRLLPRLRFAGLLLAIATAAAAADTPQFALTMANDAFQPAELTVPAGQKIELHISNQNSRAAEFESTSLHREKVVTAGGQVTVYVGPLTPGTYEFFDDFHPSTRGKLIAK